MISCYLRSASPQKCVSNKTKSAHFRMLILVRSSVQVRVPQICIKKRRAAWKVTPNIRPLCNPIARMRRKPLSSVVTPQMYIREQTRLRRKRSRPSLIGRASYASTDARSFSLPLSHGKCACASQNNRGVMRLETSHAVLFRMTCCGTVDTGSVSDWTVVEAGVWPAATSETFLDIYLSVFGQCVHTAYDVAIMSPLFSSALFFWLAIKC